MSSPTSNCSNESVTGSTHSASLDAIMGGLSSTTNTNNGAANTNGGVHVNGNANSGWTPINGTSAAMTAAYLSSGLTPINGGATTNGVSTANRNGSGSHMVPTQGETLTNGGSTSSTLTHLNGSTDPAARTTPNYLLDSRTRDWWTAMFDRPHSPSNAVLEVRLMAPAYVNLRQLTMAFRDEMLYQHEYTAQLADILRLNHESDTGDDALTEERVTFYERCLEKSLTRAGRMRAVAELAGIAI